MIQILFRICVAFGTALVVANKDAYALDCSEKLSPGTEQQYGYYDELAKIINRLKAKDPGALANGSRKILLIRRFVSGEASARGGNIAAEIPLVTISNGLTITHGKQKIKDFAIDPVFADMNLATIVRVRQSICGRGASCSAIPAGDGLDQFLAKLIECNGGQKGVFELDDAFFVLDMHLTNKVAIGEGVIIQIRRGQLEPKALVISQ